MMRQVDQERPVRLGCSGWASALPTCVQLRPWPKRPWRKTTREPASPIAVVCSGSPSVSTTGVRRAWSGRRRDGPPRSGRSTSGRPAGTPARGTRPPARGCRSGPRSCPHSWYCAHCSATAKSNPTDVPSHPAQFFWAAASPAVCARSTSRAAYLPVVARASSRWWLRPKESRLSYSTASKPSVAHRSVQRPMIAASAWRLAEVRVSSSHSPRPSRRPAGRGP